MSSREPGERQHAHGARLLGYGGQHRQSRSDRGAVLLREHRRAMGRVRAGEAGSRRVARDVQQPAVPQQSGTKLQTPRGLARKAQSRLERGHTQNDGAVPAGSSNRQDTNSRKLSRFRDVPSRRGPLFRPSIHGSRFAGQPSDKTRMCPRMTAPIAVRVAPEREAGTTLARYFVPAGVAFDAITLRTNSSP